MLLHLPSICSPRPASVIAFAMVHSLPHAFALLGLAVALFASTNVDDLLVLVGFFADPALRARNIVTGQYTGLSILFGVSVIASLLSLVIPAEYVGLLGFAPILIGIKKLLSLRHNQDQPGAGSTLQHKSSGFGQIAGVALVTIANGGDNIAIYMPSFAVHSGYEIAAIAIVFALMTALWCLLAHSMVSHPTLGAPIRRYAHVIAPVILIGLGVAIIYKARSIELLLHRTAH